MSPWFTLNTLPTDAPVKLTNAVLVFCGPPCAKTTPFPLITGENASEPAPRTTSEPETPAGAFVGITLEPLVVPGISVLLPCRRNVGEPAACPVPVRVTVCGDPAALSVMVTDALRAPPTVGVNVTEMLQFPPATTLTPHVLVCPKSPALVPVTAMLVIVRVPVPVLFRVTD